MQYVKLVIIALQLINKIAGFLERRGYMQQAEAEIIRRNTDAALKELEVAEAARQRVRDTLDRDPGSVHAPDPFQRKED